MAFVETGWCHDIDRHVLVTDCTTPQARRPLALETELPPCLGPFWNDQINVPMDGWYMDRISQCCLDKVEVELVVDGGAFTLKLI